MTTSRTPGTSIAPRDERERALLALIHEGYKMPPTRSQLSAKIAELRNGGDEKGPGHRKPR